MNTKLTLILNNNVIKNAKQLAKQNNIALSKMVEFYFKSLTSKLNKYSENIPPITKELSGIAKIKTKKSGKELLVEALQNRNL